MKCHDIAKFLDEKLKVKDIEDESNNGLQVANDGKITKIGFTVSASMDAFELAKKKGCQMVVAHHGISWKDSLKYITELNYSRMRFLIKNNIALYACHYPLDKHPDLGNNILLSKLFGLQNIKEFGEYNNMKMGFIGDLKNEVKLKDFLKIVEEKLNTNCELLDFGKSKIKKKH